MDWSLKDDGYDWAQRFDEDAKAVLLEDPDNITELAGHRDYRTAVPTPDHFLPLLYLAGLAGASPCETKVMVDGYAYGSLSMTSYTLDAPTVAAPVTEAGAADIPHVPAEQTNI
jgi:4,5-DOPA dioxygenase extradiol